MKEKTSKTSPARRKFLGQAGAAALAAGTIGLKPALGGKESSAEAAPANANANVSNRANDSFNYRMKMAQDERVNAGRQADNGDLARYTDFSGIYTKGLAHDALGVPNAASVRSLLKAFQTGKHSDFDAVIVGNPGGGGNSKLNGPQVALAFDLQGMDSHATVIPAAPATASAQTAAEAVEHYWGGILRDVNFTDYATSPLVAQAVADMNSMSFVGSPANNQIPKPVTPQNLFRGQFVPGDGNVLGPYMSQFMIQPTFYGSQFLDQKLQTFLPLDAGGSNYLTSVSEYQLVQNGGNSGRTLAFDPTFRYLRNGRD